MAFKPMTQGNTTKAKKEFDPNRKYPEPKAGSRPARISLIVDLGVQERPDFEDAKTGETKPQKPCQQVAIFADLTNDMVDYGGEVGVLPYRLMLNKSFQGELTGINFVAIPPRDPEGKLLQGKKWGFAPSSLLTKLSKAVGKPEVVESMDLEQLLDTPFMCEVEVKKTESKDKKDDNGKPIVFTNVNFKSVAQVPMIEDEDGNEVPIKVKPLPIKAKCVTFDNATMEDIKTIRWGIIQKIKTATNYEGSAMQKAIQEWEASQGESSQHQEEPPKVEKPQKPKPLPKSSIEDMDEDVPFN